MRSLIPILIMLSFAGATGASQLRVARMQPGVELSRHEPQMARLSPSLHAWVETRARASLDSGSNPDPGDIAADARARLGGQDFSDGDIEALVQLVMAESARQADADLRDLMEQMRAAKAGKAKIRESAAAQRGAGKGLTEAARTEFSRPERKAVCVDPPCRFSAIEIQPVVDTGPDSMSEMSEVDQLRMQMALDRRSKAIQALSNLLKKSSDTAGTLTSNLK